MNVSSPVIVEAFDTPPAPGAVLELLPGLLWTRIPLSGFVNHVNAWLLDDPAGWTIIDCGDDTPLVRDAWSRLNAGVLAQKPVHRFIATHGHSDHLGYAGPLAAQWGVNLNAPRTDWLNAALRRLEAKSPPTPQTLQFYTRHGCPEAFLAVVYKSRRRWAEHVAELPPLLRMSDGDELEIGGRRWQVMISSGHSFEHATLWCERDGVLIAGDQILGGSTPSLAVTPAEPLADPLRDYFDALAGFAALPDNCYVLSSHGVPYRGLRARAAQLKAHHEDRLRLAAELADTPASAFELACRIYPKPMQDGRGNIAFGLTLAYLNHLRFRGVLIGRPDAYGILRFQRAASASAGTGSGPTPAGLAETED